MLINDLAQYQIILASASPRRSELLKGLGIEFSIELNPESDETYDDSTPILDISSVISLKKSKSFSRELLPFEILITADTIVICENKVLGKPINKEDAFNMLSFLSGKSHLVSTGVTIRSINSIKTFNVTTTVTFKTLTVDEILYYIEKNAPYDKAGAYGAQDWIGYVAIENIVGSYFNVMGFPVHSFYSELETFIYNSSENKSSI